MQQGYAKLYRSMLEKGWSKHPEYVALWVYILMRGGYSEKEFFTKGGQKITLLPGQFITSRKQISINTGISESKIERILLCFQNEQQIEQQTNSNFRLISITNWHKYQNSEQQIEQQTDSKRTANGQRVDTIKKEKEVKPISSFDRFWASYPRKVGKGSAEKAWVKIASPEASLEKILAALEWQKQSDQWVKNNGEFIPHPSTYLNQRRWEDEPPNKQTPAKDWTYGQ